MTPIHATTARLGLIGDLHAEDAILARAMDHLRQRDAELLLCTGDVADGRGSVDGCCDRLRAGDVGTVRGNHDRWLCAGRMRTLPDATDPRQVRADNLEYLRALPTTLDVATPLGLALLCHGLGPNDMAAVGADDYGYALESNTELQTLLHELRYRFVLSGHTHRRMVRTIGQVTMINAGTLQRDHEPCVTVVDFAAARIDVLDLDGRGRVVGETTVALQQI
ncbi:MAG: metallophosphoesterase family protein [Deltaproteobacteria bacterium]|nr:metallophosphoesterase family protein [Deltaproteobacteria bacterium]MBW2534034.1 metallophosphoesterase family protein [Deltaproteobacteria bacterium]